MNAATPSPAALCSQLPPWITPSIAGLAFLVSCWSLFVSYRKYAADQTTPWVQILLRYVEDELKALARDAGLFTQIYRVPFETVTRKVEVKTELDTLRDESLRRLDALAALNATAGRLRDMRASLNAVTDSFYENAELAIPAALAGELTKRYEAESRRYVMSLQTFARDICKRKFIFPT